MEFRQFRYILAVAEAGAISQAAQRLYISQPSLSQLIAGVEKKLGAPLFDRSATPLRPTAIGQLYLDAARRILAIDEEFHQRVDDVLHLSAGSIAIGSSPFRSAYLLTRFLPVFQQRYPGVRLLLRESTTRRLEEQAMTGEVDFAISLQPIDEARFAYEEIFSERLLLALPPNHPLTRQYQLKSGCFGQLPEVPLAALHDTPFIQLHSEQKLHDILLQLCRQAGFTPRIQLETRSMETALAMSGAGFGAAVLPDTLVRDFQPVQPPCYAALDTRPVRRVLIIWRRSRYLSHAARAFIRELKQFCRCDLHWNRGGC